MFSAASSAERMLDSFQTFDHPGANALEYALYEKVDYYRRNSFISDSPYCSSASTPASRAGSPATPSTDSMDFTFTPREKLVDDYQNLYPRKGTYLDCTAGDINIQPAISRTVRACRPTRGSIKNYSHPRRPLPVNTGTHIPDYVVRDSRDSCRASAPGGRILINFVTPNEHDLAKIKSIPLSPKFYKSTGQVMHQSPCTPIVDPSTKFNLHPELTTSHYDTHTRTLNTRNTSRRQSERQHEKRYQHGHVSYSSSSDRCSSSDTWNAEHECRQNRYEVVDSRMQQDGDFENVLPIFYEKQAVITTKNRRPRASSRTSHHSFSQPALGKQRTKTLKLTKQSTAIAIQKQANLPDERSPVVPIRSPIRLTLTPISSYSISTKPTMPAEPTEEAAEPVIYPSRESLRSTRSSMSVKTSKTSRSWKQRQAKPAEVKQAARAGMSNVKQKIPPQSNIRHATKNSITHVRQEIPPAADVCQAAQNSLVSDHQKQRPDMKQAARECLSSVRQRLPNDVVQSTRDGMTSIGQRLPPIPSCNTLIATSHARLHDLGDLIKQSPVIVESQVVQRIRQRSSMNKFKGSRTRLTLAERVGTVEGCPEKARQQLAMPPHTQQVKAPQGKQHLKVIVPTEMLLNSPRMFSLSIPQVITKRCSQRTSLITFTEEMLNPLADPAVERIISSFQSASDAPNSKIVSKKPRNLQKVPTVLEPVHADGSHPLASREEKARARKLRDLQRSKKPKHTCTPPQIVMDLPETPATESTLSLVSEAASKMTEDVVDNAVEDDVEEVARPDMDPMSELQGAVVTLQQQNSQLVEALARMVGLECKGKFLKSDDVLKAFEQIEALKVLTHTH